jgi:hypothetical protein
MQTVMLAVPLVLTALAVQIIGALFWLRPLISNGIPLYWRDLALKPEARTDWLESDLQEHAPLYLAYRRLSDNTLGLRLSFFWGFTGVQSTISSSTDRPRFRAVLAWPTVPVYAFFMWAIWSQSPLDPSSVIAPTLIVVAIPTIDIMAMRRVIRKLETRARAA